MIDSQLRAELARTVSFRFATNGHMPRKLERVRPLWLERIHDRAMRARLDRMFRS